MKLSGRGLQNLHSGGQHGGGPLRYFEERYKRRRAILSTVFNCGSSGKTAIDYESSGTIFISYGSREAVHNCG